MQNDDRPNLPPNAFGKVLPVPYPNRLHGGSGHWSANAWLETHDDAGVPSCLGTYWKDGVAHPQGWWGRIT